MPVLAQSYWGNENLWVLGFGEIDYSQSDGDSQDGFQIGQTVLQLGASLDDRLSVFTEMTATAKQDQDFEFEIERLFIRYDFNDQFKLSAGRYHTPIGYWNEAFHHGSWLQTSIGRPETIKFGSDVIPIHFDGILLEGLIKESNFGYKFGVGNGRYEDINDPGDRGDINNNNAVILKGYYRPPGRYMIDTGFSIYFDKASPEGTPDIDERIYSLYFATQSEQPEITVEYDYIDHSFSSAPGPDGHTTSIYAQLAYRLDGSASKFKPYARYENLQVDDDDPLLAPLDLEFKGSLAGLRWDFSPAAAIKAEVRHEKAGQADSENSFWLQISFVLDKSLLSRSHSSSNTYSGSVRPGHQPAAVSQ